MSTIGVALVGCGGITLQNHLPGLALCPRARIAALCDSVPAVLDDARRQTGVEICSEDFRQVVTRDDVDAVVVATPNYLHGPIVRAAVAAGKHVFCEKPLAMNRAEAFQMLAEAEAAGVRHMTAFTYRFVPAMRYLAHLVKAGAIGRPFHFRSCRLQDWGTRSIGWRQVAELAGTGELGDMLSHRIDYAHMLIGPINSVVAHNRRFHDLRDGQPSDLEDWVALLAEFDSGATGMLESSKVATGRGEGAHSQDHVEVNGDEGSIVFELERPLELSIAKKGDRSLRTVCIPVEFRKTPISPRDPDQGDPLFTFRFDQMVEFIRAIEEERPCVPSFEDGARAQAVMEAAMESISQRRWVAVS